MLGKLFKIATLLLSLITLGGNAVAQSVIIDEYPPVLVVLNELRDINGKAYSFENFEGNVLLLHFWATWCANCTGEMKKLNQLQKALKKESIIVIPVSEDFKGTDVIREFYKTHKLKNLLNFVDHHNNLFGTFDAANLPTSFIIDTDGHNVARIVGAADWQSEKMIKLLRSYIQPRSSANADYINALRAQNGDANDDEEKPAAKKPKEIPAEAVTEISPVLNDDGSMQEGNNFTNIQTDKFSLKVKRPVNEGTEHEGERE